MSTHLERYRRGECQEVWDELLSAGAAVRAEPLFADAWAVAREAMARVRANIETSVPRLRDTGYQFGTLGGGEGKHWGGNASPPFSPPLPDAPEQIARIERKYGPLPLSLRAFWEVVGAVNFIGFHPDGRFGPDPLYVDALDAYDVDSQRKECQSWKSHHGLPDDTPCSLEIAPDQLHKYDTSGGPAYSVAFPCANADAPFENEPHETTFVNYLRICFRCAGFPGVDEVPVVIRTKSYQRFLDEQIRGLTQGLLPI